MAATNEQVLAAIDLLAPASRPCIEAARVLYCGIVDEVERTDRGARADGR